MAEWVTVEVTADTISVPAPPPFIIWSDYNPPTIGPYEFPDINYGGGTAGGFSVDLGSITIFIPRINLSETVEFGGGELSVRVPDVTLPYLDIVTREVTVFEVSFEVIDPLLSGLEGGFVGSTRVDVGTIPEASIPTYEVSNDFQEIELGRVDIPEIVLPRLSLDFPDIEEIDLPSARFPISITFEGSVQVPDPSSLRASVSVNQGAIRSFVLDPVPTTFLQSPPTYVYNVALSEAENRINTNLPQRLKQFADAFLEEVLSQDTRERLRAFGRD